MTPRPLRGAIVVGLLLLTLVGCGPPATTASSSRPTPAPSRAASHPLAKTVARGPGGSKITTGSAAVALTFDDGPDPVYTPKILDLLRKAGVKATFCLVGTNVRAYPAIVRRIVAEGHTICNHSWRHRLDLAKQSDSVIDNDLRATTDAIHAAAPNAKVQYFRAPGGNYTSRLVALARRLGMTSLYWSVDPRDWDFPTYGHGARMVGHVIAVVEARVRPGAIVLSHDFRKPDTITAYGVLLPWLTKRYHLIGLPT